LKEIQRLKEIPHVERVVPDNHLTCTLGLRSTELAVDIFGVDVGSRRFARRIIAGEMLGDLSREEILVDEVMAYRLGFRSDSELDELVGQELAVNYQVRGTKLGSLYQYLSDQSSEVTTAASLADRVAFAATLATLVSDLDKTSLSEQQKEMVRSVTQDFAVPPSSLEDPADGVTAEAFSASRTFRIRGVVRGGDEDQSISDLFRRWFHGSSGDLFLHHVVATEIQSQDPARIDDYHTAAVVIESARHLEAVTKAIEDQGLRADSALRILESIQRRINQGSWFIYAIAVAVLLASALGISNTLVISVLQRTPEFGILKAVGARDRDLVLLMLCEGALLGVIGATLALAFGWTLSRVGHGLLVKFMSSRFGNELPGELFAFEIWPTLMMYAIAMVICIGASILPAWRAARLDPVVAMRRT
jgi:putative ABC transport system permease protein